MDGGKKKGKRLGLVIIKNAIGSNCILDASKIRQIHGGGLRTALPSSEMSDLSTPKRTASTW